MRHNLPCLGGFLSTGNDPSMPGSTTKTQPEFNWVIRDCLLSLRDEGWTCQAGGGCIGRDGDRGGCFFLCFFKADV